MADIFSDEQIVKILHGCDSDLKYMIADLGMVAVNLFDTARGMAYIQRITPKELVKNGQL